MNNDSIARSARRLRAIVIAGIVMIVAVYLVGRFGPEVGPVRVQSHPDASGWAGELQIGIGLLLFVIALARLAQMLSAIADGPLFGPRVTKAFRGFAFWLFVATLVDVVAAPGVALAQHISAGATRVELAFELGDLLMLAGALFLFLLARMLEQARSIEAELEEIV
ncbi:MAG TPA: DUF2975 domain-containing protein [Sphingomicrobium sp.]|nr:DUF2975 domain-containing protein [Sphingomicrobium sp.]